MQTDFQYNELEESKGLRNQVFRYLSFWPYLILLVIFSCSAAFFYLRYSVVTYETSTIIEILDESQNNEMALPTELTIFNRSMINLENEINRLNSFTLNESVVRNTNANIYFLKIGNFKNTQYSLDLWYDKFDIDFKIETDDIQKKTSFSISTSDGKINISQLDEKNNFIKSYSFNSLSTLNKKHDLPFDLTIESDEDLSINRELIIYPVDDIVKKFLSRLSVEPLGSDSDQLSLKLRYRNPEIAQNYLNELVKTFDFDGITDKQLEYNRTITFVNNRELILKQDLSLIEERKQTYKQDNNISDIQIDATNNIDLKYKYNSEIFELESQKQIAEYLLEYISGSEFGYLPINIGLDNFDLNKMIDEYNKNISERNLFLNQASSENFLVKSLEPQLRSMITNISRSLNSFASSLGLRLKNLEFKENEFDSEYNQVPENEKRLRAIERELSIKEALYLLLLQKREEAMINLAVVTPTIKVIDKSITDFSSKKPNSKIFYLFFIFSSFILYFLILNVWFFLDNKVHNKEQLVNLLNNAIPVIGEIPFLKDFDKTNDVSASRSILSESIRMILSNLRFTSIESNSNEQSKIILYTSSIKGEGKTLASVNTALSLTNDYASNKKVILLGTDLRNPQIHKFFDIDKSKEGISEIIYKNDFNNYKNYIVSSNNLDVLFSGVIPPNPTAMLSSETFKNLISLLRSEYDYIIIDSAPCLLVSDTFQYIQYADSVVYLFRSNYTDYKIVNFINEIFEEKKIKNLNVVLNAVGNSVSYGYKYGYQYGYKYGYNYGYGYGYGEEK